MIEVEVEGDERFGDILSSINKKLLFFNNNNNKTKREHSFTF
jgi:hypothetical protein